MSLDPISYSLVKRLRKVELRSVVASSNPLIDNDVIWYDTNCDSPRIYSPLKGKWGYLKFKYGYPDFDNNIDGIWTNYINIPISTAPTESVQYKVEIVGDNINIYSVDGTTVLATATGGLDFWGKIQSDGKDIRIFDESYSQNYFWIELFDITNQKCIIWTKINAGQMELNIAYGNNNCLVSNYHSGNLTFEFFDDFDRTTLNWDNTIGKGISVSNSYLRLYKNGIADGSGTLTKFDVQIAQKNIGTTIDVVVTYKWHYTKAGATSILALFPQHKLQDDTTATSDVALVFMDPARSYYCVGASYSTNITEVQSYTANTPYINELLLTPSFVKGNLYDSTHTLIHTITHNATPVTDGTYLTFRNGWGNLDVFDVYIDYVYVRKYLSDLTFGTPTIQQF